MRQLVILLLVGLAVSAYGLDLSHAAKRSTELEPRIINLVSGLYAQVIYPPLNHIVTNLALLSAQLLAGIAQTGLPAPGGRTLHPSEAELRGFFDELWNNALKPPLENALSGVALLAAQVLAGVGMNGVNLGIGKRDLSEAEMRIFGDAFNQALNDIFANVIQKPVENALSSGALMLAQVLAGLGTNGVNLSNLGIGKRDLTEAELRGWFGDLWNNALKPPIENALSGASLLAAQVLAGVGMNGVNLGIGKRDLTEAELRGWFGDLWNNALKPPIENALSGASLLAAQVLAGVGMNGVNLGIGKRDLSEAEMRIFGDAFNQALNDIFANVIQKPVENALSSGALMLAQVLAGLGTNGVNLSNLGIGKRDLTEAEMRGIEDIFNDIFTNVIQKPVEGALSSGALMLAQVLAGLGTNGVNLSGLFGKRDLSEAEMRGIEDVLNDIFTNVIQKPVEGALSSGALMLAQVLAGLGTNGVNLSGLFGKRDLSEAEMRGIEDIFNDIFTNVIQKPVEGALSSGALMLAQVLAGLGTNGVNLSGLFGKRDLSDFADHEAELRGIFTTIGGNILNGLQSVWNGVFQGPLENFVQSGALTAAQVLAGLGTNGVSLGKRAAETRGPIINDLLAHATGLFQDQVKPVLENALNAAAVHLAGVLAGFSQTLGRR